MKFVVKHCDLLDGQVVLISWVISSTDYDVESFILVRVIYDIYTIGYSISLEFELAGGFSWKGLSIFERGTWLSLEPTIATKLRKGFSLLRLSAEFEPFFCVHLTFELLVVNHSKTNKVELLIFVEFYRDCLLQVVYHVFYLEWQF